MHQGGKWGGGSGGEGGEGGFPHINITEAIEDRQQGGNEALRKNRQVGRQTSTDRQIDKQKGKATVMEKCTKVLEFF